MVGEDGQVGARKMILYNLQQTRITTIPQILDDKRYANHYLNRLRFVIASAYKIPHPDEIPITEQEYIVGFFKAKRKSEVVILKAHQLQTWDTTKVFENVKKKGDCWSNKPQMPCTSLRLLNQ